MISQNIRDNMDFDSEVLESLLDMEEGTTLDFKRKQYLFNKASDAEKSELLKDILALVNSQRYRTAYILVGVKEIHGGRSEIAGVEEHLNDASLHQFVNYKTNRPVDFSYSPFDVDGKSIGVLSIPIQPRPVYLLKKFGKLNRNTVYVRDGSSTREASPDEIVDMGRANLPKLVQWQIDQLRRMAIHAVISTAKQWRGHPGRHAEYGSQPKNLDYASTREWILQKVSRRYMDETDYPAGMDSYMSLHWVFERYVGLAKHCTQIIRTCSSALIEYGGLLLSLIEIENEVITEKRAWDEFRLRPNYYLDPLPGQANYNLLSLAARVVGLIDVLEDEAHYPDTVNKSSQLVLWWSSEWGESP